MLHTNRAIERCRVQPLVDEDSAGASGRQIGRFHGSSIINAVFADYDRSGIVQALNAPSVDISGLFTPLAHSYALPFLAALRDGLSDAVGDRIAVVAVGLSLDLDPAELARQIAAVRRGVDAGFDQAVTDLSRGRAGGRQSAADGRAGDDPTEDTRGNRRPGESA